MDEMISVMLSVRPHWCMQILNKIKTVEIRKTKPKTNKPFKVYLYCTKGGLKLYNDETFCVKKSDTTNPELLLNGYVVGEFICSRVDKIERRGINHNFDYCYKSLNKWGNDDISIEITAIEKSCISKEELHEYAGDVKTLYAWHISNLKIYDEPKKLSNFGVPKQFENSTLKKRLVFKRGLKVPQSWVYVEEVI